MGGSVPAGGAGYEGMSESIHRHDHGPREPTAGIIVTRSLTPSATAGARKRAAAVAKAAKTFMMIEN